MPANSVCIAITNYDFSINADKLKESFSAYYPTLLIDSSSPNPPEHTDLSIANHFYPGLWNAAVNHAINQQYEWLLFIASDVQIADAKAICGRIKMAIQKEWVGIYLPSLTSNSRAAFKACINQGSDQLREVFLVEGFCFLARTSILKALYPIPASNVYGWGVDIASCYEAYRQQYSVVVDDQVMIYHPEKNAAHSIDDGLAYRQSMEYLGPERISWFKRRFKSVNKY